MVCNHVIVQQMLQINTSTKVIYLECINNIYLHWILLHLFFLLYPVMLFLVLSDRVYFTWAPDKAIVVMYFSCMRALRIFHIQFSKKFSSSR